MFVSVDSLISVEDCSPPQLVVHRLRHVLVHLHVQLVQVLGAQLKQLLDVLGELVDILWHLNHHHNDDIILMTSS